MGFRKRNLTCIEDREILKDGIELFVKGFLGEFNLSHIKVADTTDFEVFVDDLSIGGELGVEKRKRVKQTVGVFRWVLDRTMSKKSAAVGTGAMALRLFVAILLLWCLGGGIEKNKSQFSCPKAPVQTVLVFVGGGDQRQSLMVLRNSL